MSTDYRVRLESFEGPLDLLLHLIRRAEVDITDIPIATIADQYMGYLSAIDRVDIDLGQELVDGPGEVPFAPVQEDEVLPGP